MVDEARGGASRTDASDEFCGVDPERGCDPHDVVQRDVDLATLVLGIRKLTEFRGL